MTLSNADVSFSERKVTCNAYTATEALSTFKWVELMDKKKFAKAALDEGSEIFVVHVVALEV